MVPPALDPSSNNAVTKEGLGQYLADWFRGELGLQSNIDKVLEQHNLDPNWALAVLGVTQEWRQKLEKNAKEMFPGEIVIAHPDTGYLHHSDIVANVLKEKGRNFYDERKNKNKQDLGMAPDMATHGTGTASIIVGKRYGVIPEAKIIPLRTNNWVVYFSWSRLVEAINYAIEQKAHVISMSLGGLLVKSYALMEAIDKAIEAGIIVLAAAGNYTDSHITFPASYSPVIAIAASTHDGHLWRNSAIGFKVDAVAPGCAVYRATYDDLGQEAFLPSEGTSYAVAHVAGVAALWLKYVGYKLPPGERHFRFKDILRSAGPPPIGASAGTYGGGIVHAPSVIGHSISEFPIPKPSREDKENTDLMLIKPAMIEEVKDFTTHIRRNCKNAPHVGDVRELQVGYNFLLDQNSRNAAEEYHSAKATTKESILKSPLTATTLRQYFILKEVFPPKLLATILEPEKSSPEAL